MHSEIRDRHHAGEQEGDRPACTSLIRISGPPTILENAREPHERAGLDVVEHRDVRHVQQLRRSMLDEEEAGYDPEHAMQARATTTAGRFLKSSLSPGLVDESFERAHALDDGARTSRCRGGRDSSAADDCPRQAYSRTVASRGT